MTEEGGGMFDRAKWMMASEGQQGWGSVLGGFPVSLTPSYSTRRLIQFLCKYVFICMLGTITFSMSTRGAAGNRTKSLERISQTYSSNQWDILLGTYLLLMH